MSPAELVYLAVVLLVGLPSALRNWTAAALVLCYFFMQGSYYGLGITYPRPVSVLADVTVMLLIYAKQPVCDLTPYKNWKGWLAAWWLERSFWDRVILTLFPVGWCFYAIASEPWWPLYVVSLAQFIAAALDAFETYRSSRSAKAGTVAPDSSAGSPMTASWREWGYG
jgi:hypothetical protein